MKKTLNLSIIQPHLFWENTEANLQFFERKIGEIENQIDLVILPETFPTGFTMRVEQFADESGLILDWMKRMAATKSVTLAGSSIIRENGQYFNRLYWVSPAGDVQFYDKRHLFRMGREQEHFTAGTRRVVVKLGAFRLLLQICYDLRFPVFSRNKGDYDAIVYVANWPSARKNVWETLLAARAIENQAFVIAANCTGTDGEGVDNCGDSRVIDPRGKIKARLYDQPGILFDSIDMAELEAIRESFPVMKDADQFTLE